MIMVSSSNASLISHLDRIVAELDRASRLHPNYPSSLVRRAMIVLEEAGEVAKLSLDHTREADPPAYFPDDLYEELVQTAAMCLKLMVSLEPARAKEEVVE